MKNVLCSIISLFLLISQVEMFSQSAFLYQGAFNGTAYEYGYNSIPKIPIKNAPEDIDWERWSMLFDGSTYRLYFMPLGKSDRLYQFGFNRNSNAYEFGYQSTPEIEVIGIPDDANVASFSMLHDGQFYRLYFKSEHNPRMLYQCAYDESNGVYVFGYQSIAEIPVTGAPSDTDWRRWSMLHDGNVYRLYFMRSNTNNELYQFGYDGEGYAFGHSSTPRLKIIGMPNISLVKKFSMLHDDQFYRIYSLQRPQ